MNFTSKVDGNKAEMAVAPVIGFICLVILVLIRDNAVFCAQTNEDATLRHLSHDSQARCLDGSLPAYYYRKGYGAGFRRWLVYFEGGGWCYDIEQCHKRSKSVMGTSKGNPPRRTGTDMRLYTSGSRTMNPMMYNWNLAYVRYCDGGSYAGDSMNEFRGDTLYFKGKYNRDETIRSLFYMEDGNTTTMRDAYGGSVKVTRDGYNMSSATEVVIAGGSAGGLGVFLGLDHMADMVRSLAAAHGNTNVTVRGLVDSGFFMNYTSEGLGRMTHQPRYGKDDAVTKTTIALNGNTSILDYASCMRDVFMFMNISSGANPACLRAHQGGSPVRGFPAIANCIFALNLLPHIKTPLFLMQSQFDSWQLSRVFHTKYTPQGANSFGRNFTATVANTLFHAHNPGHGAMINSCLHHGTNCDVPWSGSYTLNTASANSSINGSANSNTKWNYAKAFRIWYKRSLQPEEAIRTPTPNVNWFVQDRPFPCNDCCACKILWA